VCKVFFCARFTYLADIVSGNVSSTKVANEHVHLPSLKKKRWNDPRDMINYEGFGGNARGTAVGSSQVTRSNISTSREHCSRQIKLSESFLMPSISSVL
jgi:hypothetical protein